jgi:hypothetical protein
MYCVNLFDIAQPPSVSGAVEFGRFRRRRNTLQAGDRFIQIAVPQMFRL